MEPRWRLKQIGYNKSALEWLAKVGGSRFWAWEIVIMFYSIVITVDGYAETRGMRAPKNHKERRAPVGRHLPHPADLYQQLCGLSLRAGHYSGYAMTEIARCEAMRRREALARSVPVEQRPACGRTGKRAQCDGRAGLCHCSAIRGPAARHNRRTSRTARHFCRLRRRTLSGGRGAARRGSRPRGFGNGASLLEAYMAPRVRKPGWPSASLASAS